MFGVYELTFMCLWIDFFVYESVTWVYESVCLSFSLSTSGLESINSYKCSNNSNHFIVEIVDENASQIVTSV